MIFEHPHVLFLLLAVIPLLLLFAINLRRQFSYAVSVLCKSEDEKKAFLLKMNARAALFALSFCLAVIGAAGPFIGVKSDTVRKSGSEVIFAFDISRSMLIPDLLPTRLDYAASCAKAVAAELSGIPCGVALIKGDGVLAVPLTPDYPAVASLIDALSPNLLTSAGTNLSKGINAATAAFSKDRDYAKFLVLFTDGGEGSLEAAAAHLRDEGISLIAVGTATREGGEIDRFPQNPSGGRAHSALNDAALIRAVSRAAGSSLFIKAEELSAQEAAMRILAAFPTAEEGGFVLSKGTYPVNRRGEFFALAILFFVAGIAAGLYYKKLFQ